MKKQLSRIEKKIDQLLKIDKSKLSALIPELKDAILRMHKEEGQIFENIKKGAYKTNKDIAEALEVRTGYLAKIYAYTFILHKLGVEKEIVSKMTGYYRLKSQS